MKRVIRAKGNVGKLTWFQIVALINYDWFKTPGKPTFSSEEERRAAWFAHRDILMARKRRSQIRAISSWHAAHSLVAV